MYSLREVQGSGFKVQGSGSGFDGFTMNHLNFEPLLEP